MSQRKISAMDGMPDRVTVIRWLADERNAEFRNQYAHAREALADYHAEGTIEISDETEVEARYQGEDVTLDLSATAVARNRLRIDARKWYASKLAPKKYGDRTTLAGDADNPLAVLTMNQITANPASRIKVGK